VKKIALKELQVGQKFRHGMKSCLDDLLHLLHLHLNCPTTIQLMILTRTTSEIKD
jgi:hypothetical protein